MSKLKKRAFNTTVIKVSMSRLYRSSEVPGTYGK